MSEKGIIYVMSTAVEGLIKFGITQSFEARMHQLEHSGYRNVATLKRQFAIEVNDYADKENLLKNLFESRRLGDSELFSMDLQYAIQLLSSFKGRQIYPNDETSEEVFERATEIIESSKIPDGQYYLKAKCYGQNVKGILKVSEGKLTLLSGAILSPTANIQVKSYADARDNAHKEDNVLAEDISCNSVSMAAAIVCGRNENGWEKWKNENGEKINIYRQRNNND